MSWAKMLRQAADLAARDCQVRVVTVDGWETRGHGNPGVLQGTMWHDTVTPYTWTDGQLARLLRDGHSTLKGPIANVGVGSSGNLILVAAGRAHHAGSGRWPGIGSGNLNTVGIEVQNPGTVPWHRIQTDVTFRFTYHLHRLASLPASTLVGHKEWAPARKRDPHSIDMHAQRDLLAQRLEGDADMTPEQDRRLKTLEGSVADLTTMVRDLHRSISPRQSLAEDARRMRISLRAIGRGVGVPVEHGGPDDGTTVIS